MPEIDLTRWVTPFYMAILHGNYATRILRESERERFKPCNGHTRNDDARDRVTTDFRPLA